ncbi:MAG: antibiotic biosynthesis monooxygenase [Thiolinea sp.]
MYAVIFRAEINTLDDEYSAMAARMRDLAINEYGCMEFVSATEGAQELAISYWPDLRSIQNWKSNPEHLQAQALGRKKWYKSYQVQVVEVIKEYSA